MTELSAKNTEVYIEQGHLFMRDVLLG